MSAEKDVSGTKLTIVYSGKLPLSLFAPPFDGRFTLLFRTDGSLRVSASHDGFPAHTLYVNKGLKYAYDPVARQYAHPSGLIVVTPQGRISRYFFGGSFPTGELNEALSAASRHRISSPIQQFLVLCFHYNPITGKYEIGSLIDPETPVVNL